MIRWQVNLAEMIERRRTRPPRGFSDFAGKLAGDVI